MNNINEITRNEPKHRQPETNLHVSHGSNKAKVKSDPEFLKFLMEQKREKYRSSKQRSRLFFSIGVFISLLVVITAFEWKSYDNKANEQLGKVNADFEELLDIPPTEQPPPPPVKKLQQPNIIEAPVEEIIEDIEVDFDVEITEETRIEQVTIDDAMEVEDEEVADEIFTIVEKQPEPTGGMHEFMSYVSQNINYPPKALRMGVEGKVFVQFVVNSDGSLVDFKVVKGIGSGCDEEAIRVLRGSPKWIPGKQRGKPVRVRMVMPVFFVLKI